MWHELRQRKLVQWTLAYLAVAWASAQGLQFLQQTFAWPPAVVRVATVVLAAGLLVTLVAAWYHGERGAQRMARTEVILLTAIVVLGVAGAFRVARDVAGPATPHSSTVPADEASVAVLPFLNMSGNPDDEHFSDGITEELLMALANVQGLRVPARTSSFAFKNVQLDVRDIAARLDVAHVLEGTVRRAGNRVKVTARLVAAENGMRLWSDQYERELTDVLEVQEEIARSIVAALEIRMGPDASSQIIIGGTTNPDAHDAYLRGLAAVSRRRAESVREAISLYERATELDPGFARAWAGLAQARWLRNEYDNQPVAAVITSAREAATRALEIEPRLGEAHATLATLSMAAYDRQAASHHFDEALRYEPGSALVLHWYSINLRQVGRRAEGIQFAERALHRDNLSAIRRLNLAVHLEMAGQPRRSLAEVRAAQAIDSLIPNGYLFDGNALLQLGRYDEALAAFVRRAHMLGVSTSGLDVVVNAIPRHHRNGRPAGGRYDDVVRVIDGWLKLPQGEAPLPGLTMANILLLLDLEDAALDVIERIVDVGGTAAGDVAAHASFERLRDEARYQAVLRRLGLAQYQTS